jgi:hypothetical protein
MNSRLPSSADPHIVKLVEIEEKLQEEWNQEWATYDLPKDYHGARDLAFRWFFSRMDDFAQAKIDQIFEEENHRNEGMVKVRTKKGIMLVPREEFNKKK